MTAPAPVRPIASTAAPARRKFSQEEVVRGKLALPRRVFLFGGEKTGKSSFVSGAPDAVFIPLDDGAPHLDIERLPKPETWDELLEIVSLPEQWSKWKTLVLDPINWAEEMAWARFLHGTNAKPDANTRAEIEDYKSGFQKGYDGAVGTWRLLQHALERQWKRGMNIVIVAHAKKENFKDPSGVAYDRWEPAFHGKASGLFKQWVDDILFLRHEVLAKPEKGKTVAVATGDRILHTEWSKAWDAGNRASLPAEMEPSWTAYAEAVAAFHARGAALKAEIAQLVAAINDPAVTKAAKDMTEKAGDNAERLAEIVARLQTKLNATASNTDTNKETSK